MAAPLVIVGADFTTILTPVAPTAAQMAGDGGPEYDIPPSLLIFATDFSYQIVDGGHVHLQLFVDNPSTFPRRVRATITSPFGLTDGVFDWGDGETTDVGSGLTATHDYAEGGIWGVFYEGQNAIDYLVSDFEQIVLNSGASGNPYITTPRESRDAVLNITLGRHGYEPIVAQPFPVDRLAVKRSGGATLASEADEQTLISYTPDADIAITSIPLEATADGLFRLFIGGALHETRRLMRARGSDNLLDGENAIGVPRNTLVEVKVQNIAFSTGTYRAVMRARRGPLGVL